MPDPLKIVAIVLLLVLAGGALGVTLSAVSNGSDFGLSSWTELGTAKHGSPGSVTDFTPVSLGLMALESVFYDNNYFRGFTMADLAGIGLGIVGLIVAVVLFRLAARILS